MGRKVTSGAAGEEDALTVGVGEAEGVLVAVPDGVRVGVLLAVGVLLEVALGVTLREGEVLALACSLRMYRPVCVGAAWLCGAIAAGEAACASTSIATPKPVPSSTLSTSE